MLSQFRAWAILVCAFAGFAVLCHWFFILCTSLYQHLVYPRWFRKRYDPRFLPRCSIIIPCKGVPRNARENLDAFMRLDYPEYDVILAVEDPSDPAIPLIDHLVRHNDRASLIVAGLASTCAQKNHNILAALRHVNGPQILVFADNDYAPSPQWLRELVLPLSDPTVSITTSFRWFCGQKSTVGEFAHTYINMFMYVVFTTASGLGGVGLWGGAMAIRKKDFDALDIASRWREAVVDDISLAQVAVRHRLKSVFVPSCIAHSDDLLQTFGEGVAWFTRQTLYLKAYLQRCWLAALPLAFGVMLIYALFPLAILGALFGRFTFWEWGGGAPLIFFGGEMLAALFYTSLGPIRRLPRFVLLTPILRLGHLVSYFRTIGTRTITWSGIRYTFDKRGRVIHIER